MNFYVIFFLSGEPPNYKNHQQLTVLPLSPSQITPTTTPPKNYGMSPRMVSPPQRAPPPYHPPPPPSTVIYHNGSKLVSFFPLSLQFLQKSSRFCNIIEYFSISFEKTYSLYWDFEPKSKSWIVDFFLLMKKHLKITFFRQNDSIWKITVSSWMKGRTLCLSSFVCRWR